MIRAARWTIALALLLLPGSPPCSARDAIEEEIRLALGSQNVRGQTRSLARLAWGEENENHELAARARERLTDFGQQGMEAIAEALRWSDPSLSADIMSAMMEAESHMTFGMSSQTLVAIDYALWFGSPEAKRIAMRYTSFRPVPVLLMPVIDCAYEHPQLTPTVISVLGRIRDDRARFFLAEQVERGGDEIRAQAIEALALIGGRALTYLRAWALSDEPELRELALLAILPRTTIGDLSTLYEYMTLYPDDDPTLLTALQARARLLEERFEAQQAIDSASPPLDD